MTLTNRTYKHKGRVAVENLTFLHTQNTVVKSEGQSFSIDEEVYEATITTDFGATFNCLKIVGGVPHYRRMNGEKISSIWVLYEEAK